VSIYYYKGISYAGLNDVNNTLKYLNLALDNTFDKERINQINIAIDAVNELEKEKEDQKNAPSNDKYSYKQWYINDLKIREAQKSFTKNKQVIIAVIDE
jgi:hypothetical protein